MYKDRDFLDHFSESYLELREKFLTAAKRASADIETFTNDACGPGGEALHSDVARVGQRSPRKVLVLVSGTHGVEGYSGSGCLTAWLNASPGLPDHVAVVLINLLNPYGLAWLRRQNEDNVDVNRNFVNHDTISHNAPYAALHHALVPQDLDEPTLAKASEDILAYREQFGDELYWQAYGGQYTHPDGVFYGGSQPAWSNRLLHRVLQKHCADANSIGFVDLHSGLGPFGYGTLVSSCRRGTEGFARARSWFGHSLISLASIDTDDGSEVKSENMEGHTMGCVENLFPDKTVTCATLEFGTFPFDDCVPIMSKEACLHRLGDRKSRQAREIRKQWLHVFYPNSPDWIEMIWRRSDQVIRQAIDGLSASQ